MLVSGVFECLPSRWRAGFLRASLFIIKGRLIKLCVQQPDNLKSFEVFSRLRFAASRFEQNMTSRFSAV